MERSIVEPYDERYARTFVVRKTCAMIAQRRVINAADDASRKSPSHLRVIYLEATVIKIMKDERKSSQHFTF